MTSSVLHPPSQSAHTPLPLFPASLYHFSLIILWYLAHSNELEALPTFIFLSLDLSLPLSVAAPLEQHGSIFIQSTPPSVYPSHMKSLSCEDVPWVSLHPYGSIWNCIHFIQFSNKFATRTTLPIRGRRTILIFRVSFLRGWLQAVMAGRPAHACSRSHQLVHYLRWPLGFAKTNTWSSLTGVCVCVCVPFHKGIIYLPLLSTPVAFCSLLLPAAIDRYVHSSPISSQQFLTHLNISCHSETTTDRKWTTAEHSGAWACVENAARG